MLKLQLLNFILLLLFSSAACAQNIDSTIDNLQQFPTKYFTNIEGKVSKYSNRITGKTEKTLIKLSKWESKIHAILLKTSPATAERLFGNKQLTFASLLEQLKKGETLAVQVRDPYNKYRDEITTSMNYLSQQRDQLNNGMIKKVKETGRRIKQLAIEEDKSEAIAQFIKERKKQLIEQVITQAGASKYLQKMNKEAFYYTETLKNYKDLFSDSKKAEESGKLILSKIPAFQQFMKSNSQLASLFRQPSADAGSNVADLAGLQTRASVQGLIQERITAGGAGAAQVVEQNMQQAKAELTKLKDKLSKSLSSAETGGMSDFKPNMQKVKTFAQRLEYGINFQFGRNGSLMPATADIGLSVGYKLNDKSIIGVGGSYKLGMGSIEHIRLTTQGGSIRSFIDWKLKKLFYLSGGFEMNYLSDPRSLYKPLQSWQQSALLGISKKLSVKTKFFKETKVQLLYDFLSRQHSPVSQSLIFRVGYSF